MSTKKTQLRHNPHYILLCILCNLVISIGLSYIFDIKWSSLFNIGCIAYVWIGYVLSIDNRLVYPKTSFWALLIWPVSLWLEYDLYLQAPSTGTYNAYINDVLVGNISDTDYFVIKRKTLRNPMIYIQQLFNIVRVFLVSINQLFLAIPIVAFWVFLWLSYAEPTIYTEIFTTIQKDPAALTQFVKFYFLNIMPMLYILFMGILSIYGKVPGFHNKFSENINLLIRQKLTIAAEGDIELHRPVLELLQIAD